MPKGDNDIVLSYNHFLVTISSLLLAQQTCTIPGYPLYIQKDLHDIETVI